MHQFRRFSWPSHCVIAAALLPLFLSMQAIGSNTGDYYSVQIGSHGDEGNPQGATRLEPDTSHYYDFDSFTWATFYDKVILGNGSYAWTSSKDAIASFIWCYHENGGAWGCAYGYQQYTHNISYTFPALTKGTLSWDGSHTPTSTSAMNTPYRDQYCTMTPIVTASDGASGSEVEIVSLAFNALSALDPAAKAKMKANGLIMPTLQMLWRRTRMGINTDADYLTGVAHPTAFPYVSDGFISYGVLGHFNQEGARYVAMASAIRADTIPPMVQLSVLQDGFVATNGQDYFELSSYGEQLATTPVSISRLFRGLQHTKSITVSAEGSYDINNRPLTYQWVVLRGDPSLVHITPLNDVHSRVRIDFDYNPMRPYTNVVPPGTLYCDGGGTYMVNSSMAMVGAFVNNGAYYSAPGYITSYSMPDEVRAYNAAGRIMKITYTANRSFCDIEGNFKGWTSDTFRYDSDGDLLGWTRNKSGVLTDFTKEGYQVVTRDAGRAPLTVSQVTYSDGTYQGILWTTNGLPFAYTNKPLFFEADQLAIAQGSSATLSWSITGGSGVSINQGVGTVAAAGATTVQPSATTTYTLSALVGGNAQTASVIVAVLPPLTVSLTANPAMLTVGQSAVLSWTAVNATNVSINPGVGTVENSGMRSVCAYDTTTYTLTAMGTGGTLTTNVTVYVVGKPTASFSASPASITNGGTAVLTWLTAGADTVTTNNAAAALYGSVSVSPTNTTSYTLIATGSNGVTIIPVKVYVGTPAPPSAQFSATSPAIFAGQSSTLNWNTADATTITIDQGIGSVAASGATVVSPATTTTYNLIALGAASPASTNTVTITVFPTNALPPTASITVAAPVISVGQFTTLTWLTTNAASVSIDQGLGSVSAGGTLLIVPTNTTTYTLTASNPTGAVTAMVTVTLRAPPAINTFSASPSTVNSSNPATLTWSTAGADSVSISPGIGFVTSNGTAIVTPVSTTTYTLTAVGAGGVSTMTTTVNAAPAITLNATPPMLNGLSASSALIWTTIGAIGARIDQGIGTVTAAATGGTTNVSPTVNTTYTLTATNAHGIATAQVTVYAQGSPSITTQPASTIVTRGMPTTFTAAATGTAPLQYQWLRNGTNIDGATNASYTTPATTLADDGTVFSIVVSNAIGSVIGNGALLTVIDSYSPPVAYTQTVYVVTGTTNSAIALSYTSAGLPSQSWTVKDLPAFGSLNYLSGGSYLSVTAGNALTNSTLYYTPTILTAGADSFTWFISDNISTSAPAVCTIVISTNIPIVVTNQLTLSTGGIGSGTVTLEPTGGVYVAGTVVTLTAAPDTNCTFTGWSGALSDTNNQVMLTMNDNYSVIANFGFNGFAIIASNGSNGSISPSGSNNVITGASQTFLITPATWYGISNVLVDGVSVGAPTNFTFSNVQTNHAISALFYALLAPKGTPLGWLAQHGYTNNEQALDLNGVAVWKDYLTKIDPNNPGFGASYNIVPYAEGFENLTGWGGGYTNVINAMGWSGAPGDQSQIVYLPYAYTATNLPLPAISHTNVLQVYAKGTMLTNSFGPGFGMSNAVVYLDMMAQFVPFPGTPATLTATDSGLKASLYVNTNLQLTVYHGVAATDGSLQSNTCDATSSQLLSGSWHRVTWAIDATSTNPANALAMFQLHLDGLLVTHPNAYDDSWKAQFQRVGTLPLTSSTGTWFRLATTNAVAKLLTALCCSGMGYLDDLAVTTNNPFSVVSGPYLLIITSSGNGSSSLGAGPYVAVTVAAGANTQIVYTAADWNRISTLASNNVAIIEAVGAPSYTQMVWGLNADLSNAVSFTLATPIQTGYTNVPTQWLTNWTQGAVQAATGLDNFSLHDKYVLGLDPTTSNSYTLVIENCAPSGSNIVVRLRRDVTGSLANGGMNGYLILQAANSLTSAFTNLPAVILTGNDAFDGTGHRNYTNAVDNVRKFYKAVVQ